jgi:two-component system phosphate regulon sensor histidine kinase PhoR
VNREDRVIVWGGAASVWLGVAVCCGVALIAWFGYRAVNEWQRSAAMLVDRRVKDMSDVLATALTRDMGAVQNGVLASQEWNGASFEPPYEINDLVASAFARYPYPEAFFGWHAENKPAVFFARADRRPSWIQPSANVDAYPVVRSSNAHLEQILRNRIARDALARRRYSVFETEIEGTKYQIVARLLYSEVMRSHLDAVFGFLVDLDWTRNAYFGGIAQQVARITDADEELQYELLDDHGSRVAGRAPPPGQETAGRRFPVLFFDSAIIALDPPSDLTQRFWTVHVSGAGDPTLALAARGARSTLIVVSGAAIVLGVGLLFMVRAVRASAEIALMRSDFVSTVTHELKTPLSTIRAVGETLARGRATGVDTVKTYAQLLIQEQGRLMRLVDNLLAYSRITDVTQAYSFEPCDPSEIAAEALQSFQSVLSDRHFDVEVNVPPLMPLIRADRTAMMLALDNLIDNAIRYSGHSRWVSVSAVATGDHVDFVVADRGIGIPPDEIERVSKRFVRGRAANGNGSGLGLAIVNRIARDHGGVLSVTSDVGQGTNVTLAIPLIERQEP